MSEPKKDPTGEQTGSKSPEGVAEAPSKAPITAGTALPKTPPGPRTNLELDTVLVNELGDFGRYQLRCLVFGIILVIFIALASVNYVFTTALLPTRCVIPECDSDPPEFAPAWVLNAIPPSPSRKGLFDYCQRYGSMAQAAPQPGDCPASLFNRSKLLPCEAYVYQNTLSVVYDFGLECQEWRRAFIGMMRKFGTLCALPITSYMSDRYGRRITITVNSINTALLGITRYWIKSYNVFTALEFIEATVGSGVFSSVYILMVELLGPKHRVAAGTLINTAFAVGQMILGMIAWVVPHWKSLTLAIYLPQLTALFSYCLISESVRWYMSKGRFTESEALLKKIAKVNGKTISDSSLQGLRRTAEEKLAREAEGANTRGREPGLFVQVWRHKRVLIRVLVSPIWWITTTFIYYGLAINALSLSGNRYFNFVAVAAVEIPGFLIAYLLLNRIGRKRVLTGGFWVCSGCQVAYIFMPPGLFAAALIIYLVGKCAIAMVMTSIYVYTAELYPTNNRHKLLALASMCGRIGSILAPLTPAFAAQWFADLPFVLFGSLSLLSGGLIFLTPETLGTVLPDTFEQAEKLGLQVVAVCCCLVVIMTALAKDMASEASGRTQVELDTLLVEEIGQFGRYQLRTFLLAMVLVVFIAWSNLEYVFSTARISTRCLIPECEVEPVEFSPYWLENAVPAGASQGSFDNCQRFGNASAAPRVVTSDTCPATLFDHDTRLPCDTYVYENKQTVVYDYGLACDEWRRTMIGTVTTFGTLTALPITGFVSDRWGRRVALVLNAFNTAWIGLTRYWADTYLGFIVSQFAEANFGCGAYSSVYILLTELVGPEYRVAIGAALKTCFAMGQVTLGLIAWCVPDWRTLTLTIYIPQFLTIIYFWIISESVRWYMSKGRFKESEALLKRVANVNGRQLSDKSLEALRNTAQEKIRVTELEAERRGGEPWLVVQVFRHKRILLRCTVSPVWWITTTFIYYGLSLNAVNMSGNKYLNFVAVAAVEIPGFWTAYFLMDWIGRKPVLTGAFWLCAACQVAYIFMPKGLYVASLVVYLIAKFCIAMVATSVYVYTAELYPTRHRHSLFAFSSMIGRIGSMLAPLTPAFGAQFFPELPFVLFGSLALLPLIFLTPETLGTTLPDTLEQAEQIGDKQYNTHK